MEVLKRDGRVEAFDSAKIVHAVERCLTQVNASETDVQSGSRDIAERVEAILKKRKTARVSIEEIQQLVIQQLWAASSYAAAEHYTLYREERRLMREASAVSPEERILFADDDKVFESPIQRYQLVSKFARWSDELGRRETWKESVDRVMRFFKSVKHIKLEEREWNELQDEFYALRVSPALRVLQMAGPALNRCHVAAFNCLSRETAFITDRGVRTFADFQDGDKVTVLSHTGNWREAVVRNYGTDTLRKITFGRSKTRRTVWATANHRWLKCDGTETTNLGTRDRLITPPAPFAAWSYDAAPPDEKLYWAYGFTYGDGTLVKKGGEVRSSMVRLCGDKAKYLERFTELGFNHSHPPSCSGEPIVYTGTYLKKLPSLAVEGVRLVRAFVRGFLDADGNKNTNRLTSSPNDFSGIQVTGQEVIDFVQETFPAVGVYITNVREITGTTNLGERGDKTVCFGLLQAFGNAPSSNYSVREIEGERTEDVWCLEVEEDRSFVLADGIVTGNCSYSPLADIKSFAEMLYILMQGSGFGFSVESDYVNRLHRVKKPKKATAEKIVISDDTEGWCEALRVGMERWFDGHDVTYDYSLIRPAGARLKTKGGRSSGPEPLRTLLNFVRDTVRNKAGKRLGPIDCHDIACMIAKIVQVGGVRRASTISLSDLDDEEMREAKSGDWYNRAKWRNMANNSAVYTEKPPSIDFMEEWLSLAKSNSGERGIFNREAVLKCMPARRNKNYVFGTNPCFHPDTRLSTTEGLLRIGDLFLSGSPVDVVTDTRAGNGDVLDSKAYGTQVRAATQVEMTQRSAPVFELRTAHGHRVVCTADHKFPTTNGRKKLSELEPGDTLLLQSDEGKWGSFGDYGAGVVLGLLTGDGTVCKVKTHGQYAAFVDLWGDNLVDAERIGGYVNNLVGAVSSTSGRDYGEVVWTNQIATVDKVRTGGVRLARWLNAVAGIENVVDVKSRVPECVWRGSRECVQGYLAGLFYTDGTVNAAGKGAARTVSLRLNQSNRALLEDVQALLSNFGVVSRLYLRRPAGSAPMPDGRGGTKVYQQVDNYELILSRPNALRFQERIAWFGRKAKRLEDTLQERGHECRKPERFITTVTSVEPAGVSDVFCLNQPETHTVLANGVVSGQCSEIILRPHSFCNLSIAIARPDDTVDTLEHKVKLATLFGMMQSTLTNYRYIRPEWKKNAEEERLLGVDITGQVDCPLLRPGAPDKDKLLQRLFKVVEATADTYAKRFGINYPAALTCVKPSGDSSQLFGCSSGVHARYSKFYVRRVRESAASPVSRLLVDAGVPHRLDPLDSSLNVFDFPIKSPEGAPVVDDFSALDMLNNWMSWKKFWAEHSVSCTVYIDDHEWMESGNWVYENFDSISGISFLPKDNGVYSEFFPPYEAITEEEYNRLEASFPKIDWSKLRYYEKEDQTVSSQTYACTANGCEI